MRRTIFLFAAGASLLAQQNDPLNGTKWRLDESKLTLTFRDGSFGIQGCNSISAPYRWQGKRFEVTGPAVSTMKGCQPEAGAEDLAITAALVKNHSVSVQNGRLYVTGSDKKVWTFGHVPQPSAAAVTRIIYVAAEMKDCTGVMKMRCLQVRDTPDQPWRLHYTGIEGFEHEPGIEYRLRIKEDQRPKPAADQSSKVWYLDLVVEQKVVKPD